MQAASIGLRLVLAPCLRAIQADRLIHQIGSVEDNRQHAQILHLAHRRAGRIRHAQGNLGAIDDIGIIQRDAGQMFGGGDDDLCGGLGAIGAALQRSDPQPPGKAASATEEPRRMLAVLQFSEDDDMAFVLDRMFTRENPLRARLTSGNCFLRFVVIEDRAQRRSICHALNQWLLTSAEKATGLPQDFSSSLEMTAEHVGGTPLPARGEGGEKPMRLITSEANSAAVQLNSGSTSNLHCPQPLPSGF